MERIEPLESRIAPATLTVTNTNDSGLGSLRQAILDANGQAGADSIQFNLPDEVISVIHVLSPLPTITESVTISAISELQPNKLPGVQIDGTGVVGNGLTIRAAASDPQQSPPAMYSIYGLSIVGFNGNGLDAECGNLEIADCVVGIAADGTSVPNAHDGLHLTLQPSVSLVSRSTFSSNGGDGASIALPRGAVLYLSDCRIGTDPSGEFARGNSGNGIAVAPQTRAGLHVDKSIISGNAGYGVFADNGELTVDNSMIGTNGLGTKILANGLGGILVQGASSSFYGDRNVISGNEGHGIELRGVTGTVFITNSGIGTTKDRLAALPNEGNGVLIVDCAPTADAINIFNFSVVSGNRGHGVEVISSRNVAVGNANVGIGADGLTAIPNGGDGIYVHGGTQLFQLSATVSGNTGAGVRLDGASGSLIYYSTVSKNAGAGIVITAGQGNTIQHTEISGNGGLGIDLGGDGPTPNDNLDADTGPNGLQNSPVLQIPTVSSDGKAVATGSLKGVPGRSYFIELANGFANTTITADSAGLATFSIPLTGITAGTKISALATDVTTGDTSEFSNVVAASLPVTTTVSDTTIIEGDTGTKTLVYTVTIPRAATVPLSLHYALGGTAQAGIDYVPVEGDVVFAPGETSKQISVSILSDRQKEATKDLQLLLTNPTNSPALLGAVPLVTIADDDAGIVVTNTNDSGVGSLRQAILNANQNAGADSIAFSLPDEVISVIHVLSPLPTITDSLRLDAISELQLNSLPGVQIDGQGVTGNGLTVRIERTVPSGFFTLNGLSITGFNGNAVDAVTPKIALASCVLGLLPDGYTAASNSGDGLHLLLGGGVITENRIDQTTISANGGAGISVEFAGPCLLFISKCAVGTDSTGEFARGNGSDGIDGLNSVKAGLFVSDSVVSGNLGFGIRSKNGELNISNTVIGTNLPGTKALGNQAGGVFVDGETASLYATNSVISGNLGHGLEVHGLKGHVMIESAIGVSKDRLFAIPNTGNGVLIADAQRNPASDTLAVYGQISGNGGYGVEVVSSVNVAIGAKIGTAADGVSPIPNGKGGIYIHGGSSKIQMIGSTIAWNGGSGITLDGASASVIEATTISHNSGSGVLVIAGQGNTIRSTTFSGNGGLAIDLGGDGPTPNDDLDADTGPNGFQNSPVLQIPTVSSDGKAVATGSLKGVPGRSYFIELANGFANTTITADSAGLATFSIPLTGITAGTKISALATDNTTGDTSEFSNVVAASLPVTTTVSDTTIIEGDTGTKTLVYTVTIPSAATVPLSLHYALGGTAQAGIDYVPVEGDVVFAPGETSKQISVSILSDRQKEATKDLQLLLTNPTNSPAAIGNVPLVTIADDDAGIVVTNTNDSGIGSLRQAILNANGNAGQDSVTFDFAGSGISIIHPLSSLPVITGSTWIDASSELQGNGLPGVQIDGAGMAGDGLAFSLSGSATITGLSLTGFQGRGLTVIASSLVVEKSLIGVAPDGNTAAGNGGDGVHASLYNGFINSRISDSVFSANGGAGISLNLYHLVIGLDNVKVGTNAAGTAALGNLGDGVQIGGFTPTGSVFVATKLVASANGGYGVQVDGVIVDISDSFVGTDATGHSKMGNSKGGILLKSVPSTAEVSGSVISGNLGHGIEIIDSKAVIDSSKIGTNAQGTAAMGNGGDGVFIRAVNQPYTTLGTVLDSTISGNASYGIHILGSRLQLNDSEIGTTSDGLSALGNGTGGLLVEGDSAFETTSGPTAKNVISGNHGPGVSITGTSSWVRHAYISQTNIGVDSTGLKTLANDGPGIWIHDVPGVAGSSMRVTECVIAGNIGSGVKVDNARTVYLDHSTIGVSADQKLQLPNEHGGIVVSGGSDGIQIVENTIAGNSGWGISIADQTYGVTISKNFVGVTGLQHTVAPNSSGGVLLDTTGFINVEDNVIGGNLGDGIRVLHGNDVNIARNQIGVWNQQNVGNAGDGISISNATASWIGDNQIGFNEGNGISIHAGTDALNLWFNFVGYNPFTKATFGNAGNGILVDGTSGVHITGGVAAYNGKNGILIQGGTGNTFTNWAAYGNQITNIDLGGDGLTPNDYDARDADAGANGLQNSPLLTAATLISNSSVKLEGVISGPAGRSYRIEFGKIGPDGIISSSDRQEITVVTDAFGLAPFTYAYAGTGPKFTAIATDLTTGDSSEYATSITTTTSITASAPVTTILEGNSGTQLLTFTVAISSAPSAPLSVAYSTLGTAISGVDYKLVSGMLTFEPGEISKAVTVEVIGDRKNEADKTIALHFSDPSAPLVTLLDSESITIVDDDSSLVIFKDKKVATWLDPDGDRVSLRVSQPILSRDIFLMNRDAASGGETLDQLFLAKSGKAGGAALNLSLSAKQQGGGDGFVEIGFLNGSLRNFGQVSIDGTFDAFAANRVGTLHTSGFKATRDASMHFIDVADRLGSLSIKGDVHDTRIIAKSIGAASVGGDFADSAFLVGSIGSVKIGRDLARGTADGSGIVATGSIGAVTIKGSLLGRTATESVRIQSRAGPGGVSHLASLHVYGDVANATVLAGNADRGSSDIGAVTVDGNWTASVLAAGIDPGADGLYGTADDRLGGTEPTDPKLNLISRIARLTIKGGVFGTAQDGDSFGFFAQKLGPIRIGGELASAGLVAGTTDTFIATVTARQAAVA